MELSHRENSREYVQGRARFRRLKRVPGEIDAMHANASSSLGSYIPSNRRKREIYHFAE